MARGPNASAQRVAALLNSLPKKAQAEIKKAVMAEAGKLVAYMQLAAPVRTGVLRQSIRIEDVGSPSYVRVRAGGDATTVRARGGWAGGTYDYAFAQEWGTKNAPADPFFYSTARSNKKRIKSGLKEKSRNAIVEAFGRG